MKDDAIVHLSDQVMALTARMQEYESTSFYCISKIVTVQLRLHDVS